MLDLLYSPLEKIKSAKKKIVLHDTILILFVSALFIASTVYIKSLVFAGNTVVAINQFVAVLGTVALLALVLKLISVILTGKAVKYEKTLTILTYGSFLISFGYFLAAFIGLLPFTNGAAFLSMMILIVTFAIANSVIVKSTKELLGVDLVTSIIMIFLTYITIVMSVIIFWKGLGMYFIV